jgi:hypothetical protein
VNCPRGASNRSCDNVDASTGDANAFDGFQCLAGEGEIGCGWGVDCAVPVGTEPVESSSCLAVKNAQGSEGRWWRSPDHVGLECGKSFSRDAALGTLAYLAKSRDVGAATRWWNYIQTQSWAIDFGLFTTDYTNLMCPDDHEPLYDYCGLLHTYGHWYSPRKSNEYYGIFHDVWFSLNLTIPKDVEDENNQNPDQQRKDHACEGLDPGRPGIQDYLLADQYLIKQFVGTESVLDRAGISCLVQRGPEEVLFAFLQEGSSAHVADLIIKDLPDQPRQCPADLASYTGKFQSGEGSFWYCLRMLNLVLGPVMDSNHNGIDDLLECKPSQPSPNPTLEKQTCLEQCGRAEGQCMATHQPKDWHVCSVHEQNCAKGCGSQ